MTIGELAMEKTLARRDPVRLTYQDGQVMVTPADQDIFFINAEKATKACRMAIRQEERVARFKAEFILPLIAWCRKHAEKISACFVTLPTSSVLPVYVISASEQYDFELTDELAALAAWFEEQGWSVHLSQLPRSDVEQLAGYFDLDHALQVYGD